MSNKEEKMKQGFKDREKYLEAKEKFDRLNKHIEEYKNGNFSLYKHIGEDFQNTAYFLESLIPQE